jgi:hypothetical protein
VLGSDLLEMLSLNLASCTRAVSSDRFSALQSMHKRFAGTVVALPPNRRTVRELATTRIGDKRDRRPSKEDESCDVGESKTSFLLVLWKRRQAMNRLSSISRLLCVGCAVSVALLGGKQAWAQCPNGSYSGGWYYPSYTYYSPAPVYQQAAPTPAPTTAQSTTQPASPSNGQVVQSNGQTYQSFSATPSPASSTPTYAAPSYPIYGGNYGYSYGQPTYYGGYSGGYNGGGNTQGGTVGHPY